MNIDQQIALIKEQEQLYENKIHKIQQDIEIYSTKQDWTIVEDYIFIITDIKAKLVSLRYNRTLLEQ